MQNDIFFYPRGSSKFNQNKQPLNWMGIDSRTIKKSKIVEDSCEEEAQSSKKSLESDLKIKELG